MKSFFVEFDLYDKLDNEGMLSEKTRTGGILSLILFIIGLVLVTSQAIHFFVPEIIRELNVGPVMINEHKLVNISLSLEVDLPCYFLHMDAMDSLGFTQLNINTTATFRRVSPSGKIIGIANTSLNTCKPCYGLLPEGECCESCQILLLLAQRFRIKPKPEEWEQCNNSKDKTEQAVSWDERCLIKGKITVNKAAGTFHIAPGRNTRRMSGGHFHDLNYRFPHLDLSHKIERIRIGPKIPQTSAPLQGITMKQPTNFAMVYKYYMVITPIKYYRKGKKIQKGYEYTSMTTSFPFRYGMGTPGIFFFYQFTPYTIRVNTVDTSVLQYISSTYGVIAGLYAIFLMIDKQLEKNSPPPSFFDDSNPKPEQ